MKPVHLFVGLVFLTIGVFGILDAIGGVSADTSIGRWWPLLVIGLGVAAMIAQRRITVGPVIVAAIGFLLLADRLHWATGSLFWPTALVVVGVAIMLGAGARFRRRTAESSRPELLALFSGTKVRDSSEHFEHGGVSALFGGATLDLRDAHIDDEASVDAFAMFGGVDVLVPHGWRVELSGVPILGGCEDKTTPNGSMSPDAPRLKINAMAILGGVAVANEPH